MKSILFLTDYSATSATALDVAIELAKKFGANLHILHSYDTAQQYINLSMASTGDLGMPGVEPSVIMDTIKARKEEAEQEMTKCVKQANEKGVEPITVFGEEDVFNEVENYTEKNDVDLVIMGTHGAKGFREAFIGSNAQKMVRSCDLPVLTISNKLEGFNTETVVYASDFTEDEVNEKIPEAKNFAELLGAEFRLVFINTPAYFESTDTSRDRLNAIASEMEINQDQLDIWNDFTIEEGIMNYANSVNAGVISLTTHGFTGFKKLLNDNITETVVNHSKIPVLSFTCK